MNPLNFIKRAGRKLAVKVAGGAVVGTAIVDSLVRAGLPDGTAEQVGDGIQALLVYFAGQF
tara:strand:- start:175 stop:357 length:183 start_codon:yes stop_codon:yes gene_type:complete